MTVEASKIHDWVYDKLSKEVKGFKSYRKTPMFIIQGDQVPALSVFLLTENMTAEGDFNAGIPRFLHRVRLGISIIVVASNDDKQLELAYKKLDLVLPLLLNDPSFINQIDGVPSATHKIVYEKTSEISFAELQCEIEVAFRTEWPPEILDDYKLLHLTTKFGSEETPQVQQVLEIPQDD